MARRVGTELEDADTSNLDELAAAGMGPVLRFVDG